METHEARTLLESWMANDTLIVVTFASSGWFSVSTTARIFEMTPTVIKFALRPEIRSTPVADYLIVTLKGNEAWSLGAAWYGLACEFKSDEGHNVACLWLVGDTTSGVIDQSVQEN